LYLAEEVATIGGQVALARQPVMLAAKVCSISGRR
jgi:hypothetical protein